MKPGNISVAALVLAFAALVSRTQTAAAPAPVAAKVAIVDFQSAVLQTKGGRQSIAAMQARLDPKKVELQKIQEHMQALQEQLTKGAATLSSAASEKIEDELDALKRELSHKSEDYNAEAEKEQSKLTQELNGKMVAVIQKYAGEKGYTMVMDAGNPQAQVVVWAAPPTVITDEVVRAYDAANPVH
ncbi:MAG TPA: OmpH family outer membrane protein [Bryobacteraceae bacterium]|jgi:outer membrane protein